MKKVANIQNQYQQFQKVANGVGKIFSVTQPNPINSFICPLLALGFSMMSNQCSVRTNSKIFSGGNQSSCFSTKTNETLKSVERKEIFKNFGLKHSEICTHSIHKGEGADACLGSKWKEKVSNDAQTSNAPR